MGRRIIITPAILALVVIVGSGIANGTPTTTTIRVSVSTLGHQVGTESGNFGTQTVSARGRRVVFDSGGPLVPEDTNQTWDVYVHDVASQTTSLVSASASGESGNRQSWGATISANGRFVAFGTAASNIVAGDTNRAWDVFVRDLVTGRTERMSVSSSAEQGDADSGNQYTSPAISSDGRYVAFFSDASDLVPGDTNGTADVFIRDRWRGTTRRVSLFGGGTQRRWVSFEPAISANGRFVAFASYTNDGPCCQQVSGLFVRDLRAGTTQRVDVTYDGSTPNSVSGHPALSATGRYVVFDSYASNLIPNDANGGAADIFIRDLREGRTQLLSVNSNGEQAQFRRGLAGSNQPTISRSGRFVAFESEADNLDPGEACGYGVFVRDRKRGTTQEVDLTEQGVQPDCHQLSADFYPSLSPDGRFVAFTSHATTLVQPDENSTVVDEYLRGPICYAGSDCTA